MDMDNVLCQVGTEPSYTAQFTSTSVFKGQLIDSECRAIYVKVTTDKYRLAEGCFNSQNFNYDYNDGVWCSSMLKKFTQTAEEHAAYLLGVKQ
jgi:hypothetical protein